jgi:putative ABC transport system permease protein
MPGNPLWRKAPFVLRRFPGVLASLVAAAALLALAAAASPLFVSASASAAVGDELDRLTLFGAGVYATMTGPVAPDDVEAAGNPTFAERTAALEDATVDTPHLGGIVSTILGPEISAAGEGRDDLGVRLLARTDALDHVTKVEGGGEGVWIADTTAEELGIRPGDELRLGLGTTPRDATVRVAGVYRALFLDPHTPYWRSLETDIYPQPPEFGTPPTFVIADEATITDFATELGVERVDYLWEFPLDTQALSLGEAERAAADLERLGAALGPEGGPLAELFACDHCFPQRRVEYTTGMPRAVRAAKESAGTVRGPVDLLANAGSLVALIVVGAVGAFSLARRRVENTVLVARGTGPASAGTRTALEGLLPVLAGTVLGVAVAYLVVAGVGPNGAIDRDGVVDALRAAGIRVPAALLLLGLVGGIWFARLAKSGDAHRRRLPVIPWELPVLAVAAFCLYQLVTGDAFSAAEDGGVAQPSPYLLLFPIFLLAGVAGLGARGLRRLVRRWRARSARSSEAVFLATHRLGAARLLLVLLVTASALALGMFVYAETVVSSYRATVRAASFLGTGSDVRGWTSFDRDVPTDLGVPVTKVTQLSGNGVVKLGNLPVDLLAIDAETLPATVYWNDSYASVPLAQIVTELTEGGGSLPVMLLGGGLDGDQMLTIGEGDTLPVDVVEHPRAFPGMSRRGATVVVDTDAFEAAADEAGLNSPLNSASARTQLWAKGETARTLRLLENSIARPYPLFTAEEARNRPETVAFTRTFAFLEALGLAAGLLALVGLVVYLQVRQRGRVVAFGLARRMGLTARTHRRALALELGLAVLTAFVLGLGTALVAARVVMTEVEPLASISPVPLFEPPYLYAALALGVLALVTVAGAALASRAAGRANLAEVLRLGE